MSTLDPDAYRAHLEAHPVAEDDAIGRIRRDLAYEGPGDPTGGRRELYQRVLEQYDEVADHVAQLAQALSVHVRGLGETHILDPSTVRLEPWFPMRNQSNPAGETD